MTACKAPRARTHASESWFPATNMCPHEGPISRLGWVLLATCLLPRSGQCDTFDLLPDNVGGIARVVVQIPAGQLPRLRPTLHSLLAQLETVTRGELICGDKSEAAQLAAELRSWQIPQPDRFRIHRNTAVRSLWARDRFLGAAGAQGNIVLLCPPRRLVRPVGDYGLPWFLRSRISELRVEAIPLVIEGGDLVVGASHVFVGARTMALGAKGLPARSPEQVRHRLEQLFRKPVVVTSGPEDQPRGQDLDYHVDMYLTVAHDNSVLLADAWHEAVDASDGREQETNNLVVATQARLERVHHRLANAGFAVRRLPVRLFANRHCAASYNNVIQEETATGPVVYLPQYGLPELDLEAAVAYEQLGYEVRPVDARFLYELRGSLRCVVNVVERRGDVARAIGGGGVRR